MDKTPEDELNRLRDWVEFLLHTKPYGHAGGSFYGVHEQDLRGHLKRMRRGDAAPKIG